MRIAALDLGIPVAFIQGNGDREVLACMRGMENHSLPEQAPEQLRWVAPRLSFRDEKLITNWPKTLRIPLAEVGEVLFCHATPTSDTEVFTKLAAEDRLMSMFEGVDVPLVVCGHTHMQFDRMVGATRVINAGSVGMPFGNPGAYWLLFEPNPSRRYTSYDLAKAAERIRKADYPHAQKFAECNVLQPPSEAAMLAAFAELCKKRAGEDQGFLTQAPNCMGPMNWLWAATASVSVRSASVSTCNSPADAKPNCSILGNKVRTVSASQLYRYEPAWPPMATSAFRFGQGRPALRNVLVRRRPKSGGAPARRKVSTGSG